MTETLKVNKVFGHLTRSEKRITIEQGGTRSGKTYNILLWIVFAYSYENTGHTITIVRKTFPALRASTMRDFFEILMKYDLYSEDRHNKTNHEYHLNGNLIEFISLDQPQKIRGRKREMLYINEANELSFEDWSQLVFRTTGKIILDYNPSDATSWIYDKVIPRDDADFYKTTYLDNPFLDASIISEIERLKETDIDHWRIYGEGERGSGRANIFQFTIVDKIPEAAQLISYGLDFGYSVDPSALVATYRLDDTIFVDQLIYKTNCTNADLAALMRDHEVSRFDMIFADSAEPKSIEELRRMGFKIKPTAKGKDSINAGIDLLKRYKICATKRSTDLIKEFESYRWKQDKDGNLINKPVDAFNHAIDALRYSVFNSLSKPSFGKYAIR